MIVLIFVPFIVVLIDFIGFLISGKHLNSKLMKVMEVPSLVILPLMYAGFGDENDCCTDSAVFSPDHQLTIGVIIALCLLAYFYSSYRKKIAPPVMEVIVNCFIMIGLVLNIFIAIHTKELLIAVAGSLPIILLGIMMLVKNQRLIISRIYYDEDGINNMFEKIAWKIIYLNPLLKFPIVLVLCLPVLMIITVLLLLFGQKPDSLIRAFTDTYKHGFSQLDYMCKNVECGGHYLCSVAANGHRKIVKPQRLGVRNGNYIICNRQLLISNAFEELVKERLPFMHKMIRRQYNKVGNLIHRHYHVFNNKFVADFIFILMKPLEWFFIIVLYTFDRNPENRIAVQYLNKEELKSINKIE